MNELRCYQYIQYHGGFYFTEKFETEARFAVFLRPIDRANKSAKSESIVWEYDSLDAMKADMAWHRDYFLNRTPQQIKKRDAYHAQRLVEVAAFQKARASIKLKGGE